MGLTYSGAFTTRWLFAVLIISLAVFAGSACSASTRYPYDANGRLVVVTNDEGESARYVYDVMGNIVRIERIPAGELRIFGIALSHGACKAEVVLTGQGFSSALEDNAVSFNGTPAAVRFASTSQLKVKVPNGATTGPVSVTVGARSVASDAPFIVGETGVPPSIASVAPITVAPGMTLDINGAHLYPIPSRTSLRLGGNTTVTPGYTGCGPGRPCELGDDNLISPREGASYAVPVDGILRALRPDSTLDLTRLDDGNGVHLARLRPNWISQATELVDGNRVPARWNLRVDGAFELIRYKVGPLAQTNCADGTGYGAPVPLTSQPLEELALPAQQGIYAACVIGGTGSGIWQSPAYATMRLRQIDDTGPSVKPSLSTRENGGDIEVRPEYVPWELVFIYVKYGSAAGTDCNEMSGYQRHLNNRWYVVENANEAWRFCAYGADLAENAGPAATFDFPPGVRTTGSSSTQ